MPAKQLLDINNQYAQNAINPNKRSRPYTTVVLAMSADGKIADVMRSPARFGSSADKAHLEKQIAARDAVLFGAGTLRAYGSTLTVTNPTLLQHRTHEGKLNQPIHIVITQSGNINPEIRFFQQKIERWLITVRSGSVFWQGRSEFERILVAETKDVRIDISSILAYLYDSGIKTLAVLGGGELVASMLELDLIDELWLTVCPVILGGEDAPTPVQGKGFLPQSFPSLELLEVKQVEQEIFLHYRVRRGVGNGE